MAISNIINIPSIKYRIIWYSCFVLVLITWTPTTVTDNGPPMIKPSICLDISWFYWKKHLVVSFINKQFYKYSLRKYFYKGSLIHTKHTSCSQKFQVFKVIWFISAEHFMGYCFWISYAVLFCFFSFLSFFVFFFFLIYLPSCNCFCFDSKNGNKISWLSKL